MPVRLRLARFGRKAAPFYRIFVADARAPRDGKHIAVVGHFDPIPGKDGNKHITLNIERIKPSKLSPERNVTELKLAPRYWMSVGAQPSAPVARLLGQAGVMPPPPPPQSQQTGPKKPDKGKK